MSCGSPCFEQWIGARLTAGRGNRQSIEVVLPTVAVRRAQLRRCQTTVHELEVGAVAIGDRLYFDRGRARWHGLVRAFPAPGHDDARVGNDLDEGAARDVLAVHIDRVGATGTWIEIGGGAYPAQQLLRIGEEGKDGLGSGGDVDLARDGIDVSDRHGWRPTRVVQPRRRP